MFSKSSADPPAPLPASRLSRRRLWAFRAVTLLVLAAGQEALFRAVFPTPEIVGFNRIHYQQMAQSHSEFSKALTRGLAYDRILLESRPDGFVVVDSLNAYGFRGPDFRADPDPARRRILVIGDSVVEGQGVDDRSTITAEWSRLLARDGTPAEVINLGVIAASLPHLWSIVNDAVPALRPADVVIALYPNDLPAPYAPELMFGRGKTFPRAQADYRPRAADLIWRAIIEKPIHRRWFHPPIRFFSPAPDEVNPWSDGRSKPPGLRADLFEAMREGRLNPWLPAQAQDMPRQLSHDFSTGGSPIPYLERMRDVCRAAGARMMVAYTPFCGTVNPRYAPALVDMGMDPAVASALATDPKYRSQRLALAEVCRELDLPLADATPDLEAAEAVAPQYWPYDTHPNADGSATIARRVHETWKASLATAPAP